MNAQPELATQNCREPARAAHIAWMAWSRYPRPPCRAARLHLCMLQAQSPFRPAAPGRCPRGRQRAPRRKYNTRARAAAPGLGKAQHSRRVSRCRAPGISRARAQVDHGPPPDRPRPRRFRRVRSPRRRRRPAAPSALSAYVPQGLSASEYAAKKAADASKKQANKSRFPQGKNLVKDVADWLVEMEAKQTFNGDQIAGSGHTFAKEKFNSKAAFDVANGRRDKGYGGKAARRPAPRRRRRRRRRRSSKLADGCERRRPSRSPCD